MRCMPCVYRKNTNHGLFFLQYTLNGDTAESFQPPYDVEEISSVKIRILEKKEYANIDDVAISVCCHPHGKDKVKPLILSAPE